MNNMAKLVLLTGLIGSGKSTVAKMLSENGYVVHNTDSITKKVLRISLSSNLLYIVCLVQKHL